MNSKIELIDGVYWPVVDAICRPYTLKEMNIPSDIANYYCRSKRVVVQAGGNVGLYAKEYAKLFETVYTFEPDPINFHCLNLNVTEPNVIKMQSCLGYNSGPVSMEVDPYLDMVWAVREPGKKLKEQYIGANTGAYTVSEERGIYPVLNLDHLNLRHVDLIHLDIEGYEGIALQGSMETIKKFKPVLALELGYNHGERYHWSTEKVVETLTDLGYVKMAQFGQDYIFVNS